MTKQIEELMALAREAPWTKEALETLRSALEAALKPGEPIAFYDGKKFYGSLEAASMCMADAKKIVPVYTAAPPAQPDVKPMRPDAAAAAIQFSLSTDDGRTFLELWQYGDFDIIRREWPDAPDAVFAGADPLHTATPPAPAQTPPLTDDNRQERALSHAHRLYSNLLKTDDAAMQAFQLVWIEAFTHGFQCGRTAVPPAQTPPLKINPGERYAGLVLDAVTGLPSHHLVLLPGEAEDMTWEDASKWAKEKGGDLPTRQEQSLLFANLKSEFQPDWYWSGEKASEVSAWYQVFRYGFAHNDTYLTCEVRVRAVRRISATPPAQTPAEKS